MKFDPYGTQAPPPDLFPEDITRDPWVYFHGTSSICEESIDASGLSSAEPPVSLSELKSLLVIFKSMNWVRSDSCLPLTGWSLPCVMAEGAGRHLFFANDPEVAAQYATRPNAGGEAVCMMLNAIRELRRYFRYPSERIDHMRLQLEVHEQATLSGRTSPVVDINLRWLRTKLDGISELAQRLEGFGRSHRYGVVYAVRFQETDLQRIRTPGSTLIYHGHIPKSRIIGKAIVMKRRRGTKSYWDKRCDDFEDTASLLSRWRLLADAVKTGGTPVPEDPYTWVSRAISADPTAGIDLTETMRGTALREYLAAKYPGIVDDPEIFPPLA